MANKVPQTVEFVLTVEYRHWDRLGTDKPSSVRTEFDNFEAMLKHVWKERKRRARADRATGAFYEVVLTELGRQRCEEDAHSKASHEAMLNKEHRVF